MTDPKIQISGYKPNPNSCCEACVFGRGAHAEWCAAAEFHKAADAAWKRLDEATRELHRQYDPLFGYR